MPFSNHFNSKNDDIKDQAKPTCDVNDDDDFILFSLQNSASVASERLNNKVTIITVVNMHDHYMSHT